MRRADRWRFRAEFHPSAKEHRHRLASTVSSEPTTMHAHCPMKYRLWLRADRDDTVAVTKPVLITVQ